MIDEHPWRETGSSPPLPSDEVHVWTIRLDPADWRDSLSAGRLSSDELERARLFPFEREQRRFAVCRATVRAILGAYLGRAPCELRFAHGPHGKPHLEPEDSVGLVRFNVSHSHELALVAVSRQQELGIDVERLRPLPEMNAIVARNFGSAERALFERTIPSARLSVFYRYWTMKEAYLKACGIGLSQGLEAVEVTGSWDRPIRLPDVSGAEANRQWRSQTLDPAPGYVAALVVEGSVGACVRHMSAWPMTP